MISYKLSCNVLEGKKKKKGTSALVEYCDT